MHGPHAIIEEILDWRPFDYLTLTTLLPMLDAPEVLMSYVFAENDHGTHIQIRVAKPKPKDMPFLRHVAAEFEKHITDEVAVLRGMLECRPQVTGQELPEFTPQPWAKSSVK